MAPKRSRRSSTVYEEESSDSDEVKPKKRAVNSGSTRPAAVRSRLKARKLKLLDFPLDVIYEAFSYLDPVDILHLSRTNHALHKILTHRSAITVWKACIRNLDAFPLCPFDLNELQWVNLVFSAHCHFCLKKGCTRISWGLRLRCCTSCQTNHFVAEASFSDSLRYPVKQLLVPAGFPTTRGSKEFYLRRDVQFVKTELNDRGVGDRRDRLIEFLVEREAWTRRIAEHVVACERWTRTSQVRHEKKLNEIRAQRTEAIVEKLIDLGWSAEIEKQRNSSGLRGVYWSHPNPTIFQHSLAQEPKMLTESNWKKIKAEVIEYMERKREERIAHQIAWNIKTARPILDGVIIDWAASCPDEVVLPIADDVCLLVPFRDVIIACAVDDVELTVDNFKAAVPLLSQEWDAQLTKRKSHLLSLIPPSDSESAISRDESSLDLATTMFRVVADCGIISSKVYDANDALYFSAFWLQQQTIDSEASKEQRVFFRHCMQHHPNNRHLREGTRFEYATNLQPAILHVLQMCKKDPSTTKMAEMDKLDPWFRCDRCSEKGKDTVVHWRDAVKHGRACDYQSDAIRLSIVEANERDRAQQSRAPKMWYGLGLQEEQYRCARCGQQFTWSSLKHHLLTRHGMHVYGDSVLREDILPARGQSRLIQYNHLDLC